MRIGPKDLETRKKRKPNVDGTIVTDTQLFEFPKRHFGRPFLAIFVSVVSEVERCVLSAVSKKV